MMRSGLCFALLPCLAAASLPGGVSEEFKQWAGHHEKEYESDDEAMQRFGIWTANRDIVDSHNKQEEAGVHTFRMKLNQFGDLTVKEYRDTLLGLRPRSRDAAGAAPVFGGSAEVPPTSWDWRPRGVVNDVKNQAQCGSCWAFSAVAAMEGAYNLKSNGTVPAACADNKCGPNKTPCCSFSEQELVDCVNGGADNCTVGGEMHDGILEISKQMKGTINTEKQYPYSSGGGDNTGKCNAATGGVATGITGYTQVTQGDEKALLTAVWKQPIISIGIDASQQSFQFYSSGVYVEPKCKNAPADLDHGVAIVGYGVWSGPAPSPPGPDPAGCVNNDDETSCGEDGGCHWCSFDAFCLSNDQPCSGQQSSAPADTTGKSYWIVRNSWGDSWGMDGYVLMGRDMKNQCGVSSDAVFANVGSEDEDFASSTIVV